MLCCHLLSKSASVTVGVYGLVVHASWVRKKKKKVLAWGFGPDGPPACQKGVSQKVCEQCGRGRPQSYLHEEYRSWRDGRSQLITHSTERMTRCTLTLGTAAAYQMVMEEVGMDCQFPESSAVTVFLLHLNAVCISWSMWTTVKKIFKLYMK